MASLSLHITSPQKDVMGRQAIKIFDGIGGTIGRSSNHDWVLPDSERIVSSQHALITLQNDQFFITDLSTNGIFANGSDQAIGNGNTAALDSTHTLVIGQYTITVSIQASSGLADHAISTPDNVSPPNGDLLMDGYVAQNPMDLLGANSSKSASPDLLDLPHDLFSDEPTPNFDDLNNASEFSPAPQVADAFIAPSVRKEPPAQASVSTNAGGIPENWDESSFMDIETTAKPAFQSNAISQTDPFAEPSIAHHEISPEPDQGLLVADSNDKSFPADNIDIFGTQTLIGEEIPTTEAAAQAFRPALQDVRPVSKKAAPAAQSSADSITHRATGDTNYPLKLARASFKNNGLDPLLLDNPQLVDQSLAILPHVLNGILATLRSRAEVKNELRATQTILQPIENNPLKFSVGLEDAIQNLLINQKSGFLNPEAAIKQAFEDLTLHEAAVISGIQSGLNALLLKMSPDSIETKITNLESKKNLFGKISSSKKWDFYKSTYGHIMENSSDSFIDMFGYDFVKGYEAYISTHKRNGK
jgi:type VI secretion system protein